MFHQDVEQHGRLMLVDFQRAEIRVMPPLGTLSPNRKRNLQGKLKSEMKVDEFNCEMERENFYLSIYQMILPSVQLIGMKVLLISQLLW